MMVNREKKKKKKNSPWLDDQWPPNNRYEAWQEEMIREKSILKILKP